LLNKDFVIYLKKIIEYVRFCDLAQVFKLAVVGNLKAYFAKKNSKLGIIV
tara:strand:+ start:333 stop:482 length:150 start_codon:yes stop_codon:yes gene_type:complete